jgi:type VII secretion integral membrane protein EccD
VGTGLARITISTPQRRLDVALPDRVPVAELLPELLRHAGDSGHAGDTGHAGGGNEHAGWVLRRADGVGLSPTRGLAAQGIVDGQVLHLAPLHLTWPQPDEDDPAEALAAGARRHGPQWSTGTTRVALLALAALLMAGGLAAALLHTSTLSPLVPATVAAAAGVAGVLATRARQPAAGLVGTVAGLAYAFAAGASWAPGGEAVAAGAGALLVASLAGAGAVAAGGTGNVEGRSGVGQGRHVYVAGATAGLLGMPAALAGGVWGAAEAAAVLACVLVYGAGALPVLAIRLGGFPLPPIGGGGTSPEVPGREVVYASVARIDDLLTGALTGWAALAAAAIGVLLISGGWSGQLLAAVVAAVLVLRARLYVAIRHRLPLLAGGLAGGGLLAATWLVTAPAPAVPVAIVAVAAVAGVVALAATTADRRDPRSRRPESPPPRLSPRAARLADAADTLAVVAVLPLAAAVLDLYTAARDLLAPVTG